MKTEMKHALYITCYNHVAMLERLLNSGLLQRVNQEQWKVYLFDQSIEPHVMDYAKLANELKLEHVINKNQGASAAKRAQITHALENGHEIMAQISEDFHLCKGTPPAMWLPNGNETFFSDAYKILKTRPQLAFVNWTFARLHESDFWNNYKSKATDLTLHKVTDLAHVEGDVMCLGWPYTARTRRLAKLLIDVESPHYEEMLRLPDGGEGVLACLSLGQGASLFAQPVVHDRPEHLRPENRLP